MPLDHALAALRDRRVYDLSREFHPGMPVFPSFPPFTLTPLTRHGDRVYSDGYTGSDELVTMCNHSGTHLDALCHGSVDGRLFDGTPVAQGSAGFATHGIETVSPIVRRAVLLDIPPLRGVEVLEPAEEVTARDLQQASADVPIAGGDVVLIRTGWMRYWGDRALYEGRGERPGMPGPGLRGARFLARKGIWGSGSDTIAYERYVAGARTVPVHKLFLAEEGIFIFEGLDLEELARDGVREFLLVAAPIKFRGATGGPIRPLAFV